MYCYQELIDNIQKPSMPSLLTIIRPKVVCCIGFHVSDDIELVFWCKGISSIILGDCRMEYSLYPNPSSGSPYDSHRPLSFLCLWAPSSTNYINDKIAFYDYLSIKMNINQVGCVHFFF